MQQIELITVRVHGHSKTRIQTVGPWVRIPLTFSWCWYRQCLCDRLIPRQRTPNTCLKDPQFQKLLFRSNRSDIITHQNCSTRRLYPHTYIKAELADVKDGQQPGRAMVDMNSRRSLTAEAQIRSQASRCRICGGQTGIWSRFPPSTSVTSCHYHFPKAPHAFIGL